MQLSQLIIHGDFNIYIDDSCNVYAASQFLTQPTAAAELGGAWAVVALVDMQGLQLFPFLPFWNFPAISSLAGVAPSPGILPCSPAETASTRSSLLLKLLLLGPRVMHGMGRWGVGMSPHCYPGPHSGFQGGKKYPHPHPTQVKESGTPWLYLIFGL